MNDRQSTPDILGGMLTGETKTERVKLTAIKVNGGTQMRAGLNAETVAEYAESMKERGWGDFPAIIVYYDGQTYWLADGFHRLAAFRMIGVAIDDALIPAIVKAGDQRAAILHAAGANAQHGLRRTNDDKRRAVEVLLGDAEWSQWSNVEIAKRCAVDEITVRRMRSKMETTSTLSKSDVRIGADGRTYNTANIGTNRPVTPKPTVAASTDFAPVWVLEGIVDQVWNAMCDNSDPVVMLHDATGARQSAAGKAGIFWNQCRQMMGDDIRGYRHTDLQQAINNVANRKEEIANRKMLAANASVHAQPVPTTQPAPRDRTHVLSDIRTWLYAHAATPKEIVELGEALHYREFGHPQWDDMFPDGAENDDVYWALEQCIDEAAAKVPEYADGLPAPAPAPVFTFTPATEIVDDVDDAQAPVDENRHAALRAWWVRLISLRSDLGDWADLTGRHTETLVLGRELTKLLDITQGEIDALEKGVILA